MSKILRSAGVVFLVTLILLISTVASVRAAEPPRFQLSTAEARAGSQVTISQIDPCPALGRNVAQYVMVELFYVDGARSWAQQLVEEDGSWPAPLTIRLPYKSIDRYDTTKQYPGPTLGTGHVAAHCLTSQQPLTLQYESQPFTLTKQAPESTVSPASVQLDSTVHVSGNEPCPVQTSRARVLIAAGEVSVSADVSTDTNGVWIADVTIPKIVHDPMFGDRPFPTGKAVVSVWCYGDTEEMQYYADQLLEVNAKPIRMVALGDSFSSGEGTFTYYDTKNGCHRSELGYPPYLAKTFGYDEYTFAACSGAVTDDFYVANPNNANEPSQLSRLTVDTELVTLTIGGNDAGFTHVLNKCIKGLRVPPQPAPFGWGCADDKALKEYVNARLKALEGRSSDTFERPIHSLLDMYRKIHQSALNARIYVGGYPKLFGDEKANYTDNKKAPSKKTCKVADNTYSVDFRDAQWINKQAERLNDTIKREVKKAKSEGIPITFVQPLLGGHRLCDKYEPWLNELLLNDNFELMSESFHPRDIGYDIGYGIEFVAGIKN